MRQLVATALTSRLWEQVIITIIVLNSVVLGLMTYPDIVAVYGAALHVLDVTILAIFVAKLVLRISAFGPRFFRDPWSI